MNIAADKLASIEQFLLAQDDWIPIKSLCEKFDLDDRDLRAKDHEISPIARFAVTNTSKGIRHARLLSTAEYIKAKHLRKWHSIVQLRTVDEWEHTRHHRVITRPPDAPAFETFTNQELLPIS